MALVVPVALIGRRWGARSGWAAAIAAMTILTARVWSGGRIDVAAYLAESVCFVTVATLAGAPHARSQPSAGLVASSRSCAWPGDKPIEDRPLDKSPSPEHLLTPRELDVLLIMAEGATNGEIARRLVIAGSTVQSHVKSILRKLGARNRTQAVAIYLRRDASTARSGAPLPTSGEA
jgi:DNA-binding CsgD family transcriptional regulator